MAGSIKMVTNPATVFIPSTIHSEYLKNLYDFIFLQLDISLKNMMNQS